MNKNVIGYYYTLSEDFLAHMKMDASEFLGSKVQLCFGKIESVSEDNRTGKLKEEAPDDIIETMLNQNIGEIVSMDGNKAKVIFSNPIPEDIFMKYYNEKELIYGSNE